MLMETPSCLDFRLANWRYKQTTNLIPQLNESNSSTEPTYSVHELDWQIMEAI